MNLKDKTVFKNKSIVLAMTKDNDFFSCFTDNLKYLGFENVILIKNKPFKYKKLSHKIQNFIHKTIFKNKEFKKQLIKKYDSNAEEQIQLLEKYNSKGIDYGLVIRADVFKKPVLKKIKEKTLKTYAYQWDGLDRYPKIKNRIHFFDKFYVFDSKDIKNNQTYPLTNFYFDCYQDILNKKKPEFDFYYLGSYDNRINNLIEVCEALHKYGFKLNINIPCSKKNQKKLKKYSYINFPKRGFTYKENLKHIANTKFILDINNSIHNGLSFRVFEALGYDKKIITTNTLVKNYDFYDQNFIHIYKGIEDTLSFIKSSKNVDNSKLKYKYSFTNWLKYVLNLEGKIDINFPTN